MVFRHEDAGIRIISRDRAGDYLHAAVQAVLQARQIADPSVLYYMNLAHLGYLPIPTFCSCHGQTPA